MQISKDIKYQKIAGKWQKGNIYLLIYYLFIYNVLVFLFQMATCLTSACEEFHVLRNLRKFYKKGEP